MVYVFLGTGFEETEAIAPIDLMRRAGLEVITVGIQGKTISGGHNIPFVADITLEEMDLTRMDMLMLPGGLGGVSSVMGCEKALDAVRFAYENGKWVAAICAAPTVLAHLGITDGKHATCYPGCEKDMGSAIMEENKAFVVDGKVITGTSAGCAIPFGLALVEALCGREKADEVAQQIVIR